MLVDEILMQPRGLQEFEIGVILNRRQIDVRHLLLADSPFAPYLGARTFLQTGNARLPDFSSLYLTEKLDLLGARYDELTQQLSTSEAVSDSARFQKIAKQHAELEEIVEKHREYKQIEKDLAGAHQMFLEAEDAEMKQMAHEEEKHLVRAG